jgi:hypothetical protein
MAMKREECKQWVMQQLQAHGGEMTSKSLELAAQEEGYSYTTLRRAKDELKKEEEIRVTQRGCGDDKGWWLEIPIRQFSELPEETQTPWTLRCSR